MATIKSFTDIEQSRKLAEILPIESADMCYIAHSELINIHEPFYKKLDKEDIPCWSLAALLSVMKEPELIGSPEGTWLNRVWYNGFPFSRGGYNNPVDACVAMIEKLHELNLL